jgi:hypothetical protein
MTAIVPVHEHVRGLHADRSPVGASTAAGDVGGLAKH